MLNKLDYPERGNFMIFAWKSGFASGGWKDFKGAVAYLSSAVDFAKNYGNCWQIVDRKTCKIVQMSEDVE